MIKILLFFCFSLMLVNNAYSADKWLYFDDYSKSELKTTCADGYKFLIVRGPEAISVVQVFEINDGKSLPERC